MIAQARKQISINVDIMDLLNKQIEREQRASSVYLAMASWCDQNGYVNAAEFFYNHSLEEREHMMKIFTFINKNGGSARSPQIESVNHEFSSLGELFETGLAMEVEVSENIQNIVISCRKENDLATELFMGWFVSEQLEEEEKFRDILDVIELMDNSPRKLIDYHLPTK